MADFPNIDSFTEGFKEELLPEWEGPVSYDSNLVEDLQFDSLQMLAAAEYLSEVIGSSVELDFKQLIEALETVRSAHNFVLTMSSMPATAVRPPISTLSGKLIQLKPPMLQHYSALYQIATSNDIAWRWRYGGTIPNYDEFIRTFSSGVLTQFVVCRPREDIALGLVVAYGANLQNRTAYFAAVIDPSLVGSGAGAEAVRVFLSHIFDAWDFEKLYMEVPEFNLEQFASGQGQEFHEEGRLKGHLYHAGRRWDQFIFAVYREPFVAQWGFAGK